MIKLLRKPAVLELYGVKTSTFDKMVAEQQFTPPVQISERLQAWPDYEVEAINRARISGCTDNQLRDLVMSLVSQRKDLGRYTLRSLIGCSKLPTLHTRLNKGK